ncbi:adenylate/guanylate cyclase domain-containing protein [Ectothiorhodospira marina]|uniref:Adenylate cyclase n=1 Tax=Ectothiorhodospira marina TaxID=1396821 RepID=A0A1H7IK07_9GAMM|nr:adenylate/guanylate cyclase domain-containing protein [Ectothiorhodospira marina]SEK61890.1 adenylate cyclase [Ectothiorhodospira marina]
MASLLDRLRSGWAAFLPDHVPVAFKLGLTICALIVTCMALVGVVILNQQSALLRSQMDDFGQAMVMQLAESSKELVLADDSLALNALITNLAGSEAVLGAAVFDRDGERLAHSGMIPEAEKDQKGSFSDTEATAYRGEIRFQDITLGSAMVTLSRSAQQIGTRTTTQAIILTTVFMSVLGGAAAFIMGQRLSRPVHRLVEATRAIGDGDYRYRLPDGRRDEIGHLMSAFNRMAQGLLEKSQVEGALSRYVSAGVAREIMSNLDRVSLGGRQVEASVMFADIAGFTRLSETMDPDQVARLLNEYFTHISHIARQHQGSIDKFMGDGVMVVFGVTDEDPDHRFHAIASGVMLQHLVSRLNRVREEGGQEAVRFRVGINSGPMMAGNMGAEDRMQYTVVGDAVNLASRLMTAAEPGQVLIHQALFDDPDIRWRVRGQPYRSIAIRGKSQPVATCQVHDLSDLYQEAMERQIERLLCRERIT